MQEDMNLRSELIKEGKLSDGYHPEMEVLHNSNARELERIIDIIGYPTPDKVGEEASDAAWLIIQHAIGQPNFMKKAARLLAKAVKEDDVDPKYLAYLTDRIRVFEGKAQLYGTQFDWDENGDLSPNNFDDIEKVNQRRKDIGLNKLEDQISLMKEGIKKDNISPPHNLAERKLAYENWRRKVGWIK